jgi:hypothetical protein
VTSVVMCGTIVVHVLDFSSRVVGCSPTTPQGSSGRVVWWGVHLLLGLSKPLFYSASKCNAFFIFAKNTGMRGHKNTINQSLKLPPRKNVKHEIGVLCLWCNNNLT